MCSYVSLYVFLCGLICVLVCPCAEAADKCCDGRVVCRRWKADTAPTPRTACAKREARGPSKSTWTQAHAGVWRTGASMGTIGLCWSQARCITFAASGELNPVWTSFPNKISLVFLLFLFLFLFSLFSLSLSPPPRCVTFSLIPKHPAGGDYLQEIAGHLSFAE